MALGGIALPPAIMRSEARKPPEAQAVCDRMVEMDKWRTDTLRGYSGMRLYTLSYGGSRNPAEMLVSVEYAYPGRKTFHVVSQKNSGVVQERIFRRVMDAELAATRDEIRDSARITPRNYDFAVVGADNLDSRPAYVLRLIPKRKQWFLVDGKIWVDKADAAVTRIDGEVATGSFWVRTAHMVQCYARIGPYWLVSSSQNSANVRFLGEAHLNIEYFDYRLRSPEVPEN